MDIMLNDGTYAMNVKPHEYEQLKEMGLVGNAGTTTTDTTPLTPNEPTDSGITWNDLFKQGLLKDRPRMDVCWKCGMILDDTNRSSITYTSNPPKYTCKACEELSNNKRDVE